VFSIRPVDIANRLRGIIQSNALYIFSKSCFKVDETTVGATTLIIDVRATQRPILDFHGSRHGFRYGNRGCDKRSNDFRTPGLGTSVKNPGQQKAPPRP